MAFAQRFPKLAGRRLVLFLGRLHPKKQPEVLIEAFARIADTIEGAHLVLAGPGDERYLATLAARVRSRGVAERTTFTGPLTGAAVTEAYRAAEIFVLPSLQENFGNAIIEAMAAGCPVLVSDRLDLAEEIDKAQAGLVCPATADDFAAALRALLDDPAAAAKMGANGHDVVLKNYTWDPITDRLAGVYHDVIERSSDGPVEAGAALA
jgi:glycosyltransferase involved in cell wall biosynthesis